MGPRIWFGNHYLANVSHGGTVLNNRFEGAVSMDCIQLLSFTLLNPHMLSLVTRWPSRLLAISRSRIIFLLAIRHLLVPGDPIAPVWIIRLRPNPSLLSKTIFLNHRCKTTSRMLMMLTVLPAFCLLRVEITGRSEAITTPMLHRRCLTNLALSLLPARKVRVLERRLVLPSVLLGGFCSSRSLRGSFVGGLLLDRKETVGQLGHR